MTYLNEAQQYQIAKGMLKKWGSRVRDVEAVRRSQGRSFSDSEAVRLCQLLESVDEQYTRAIARRYGMSMNEATQTTNVNHGLKLQTFDLITGVFPNLIAEELVSIQPLTQKTGQIFYLKYIRGSQKGNLAKNSTLVDQWEMNGYEGSNYTSEQVDEEAVDLAGGTSFNLAWTPVRPGQVVITNGTKTITDDAKGNLSDGGTIDYASGAVNLNATLTGDVTASYRYDLEYAPSTIPEIGIEIRDTFVTARPRKLKSLFSLDAAYDIQQSQGIDIADTLLVAAANEMKHETDADIILDLWKQAGLTSTWADNYDMAAVNEISRREHVQTFADEIHQACTEIYQQTKRVMGNFVIVGKKGADLLNIIGAPRFVASGAVAAGPYFAGTLDGTVKVYFNPFFDENAYLVGYKGNTLVDAGYVYAPYMMFYATDLVMLDDFVGRRGYATSYGKRMLENKLYVKGVITGANAYRSSYGKLFNTAATTFNAASK